MAGQRRVRGDKGFSRLLKQLPDTVRAEMGDVLNDYGRKLLAAQKSDVPVDTGELRSRLSMRLSRKTLRLRVGFVGRRANGPKTIASRKVTRKSNGKRRSINDQFVGDQFYGRFVEFGRKSQTVRVTRKARVTGRYRSNETLRFRNTYSGAYTMNVRRMAPRPFIFKARPGLRGELRTKLQGMWARALASASVGAGDD